MNLPLDGIIVLDLTKVLAGPFCCMQLADFGATVIKIEPPGLGDDSRYIGPHVKGESTYFVSVNRNKKSVTLNLKSPDGIEIFRGMVKKADVLVENFRPGTMDKLGLGYQEISGINPSIIYASGSGFGQTGPYREKPAYDPIVQSLGGIMSVTGDPGGHPVRVGVSIGDLAAGLYLTQGILLALLYREKTGRGQHIDVAMLDCQVALLENHIARYLIAGQIPRPIGNRHPSLAPFGSFATADGHITIAAGNNKLWALLCDVLGKPHLVSDPRFVNNVDRVANYSELAREMEEVLRTKTSAQWADILNRADIPCAPVQTVEQVIDHPQVRAREMIVEQFHPVLGKVSVAGVPVKMSATPGRIKDPAPLLGQHTEEVLRELMGFDEQTIKRLKKEGVI
ncbi:MAG: CoA transferase [Peptococcaceae bacterium]|nr:CoA transferase [Peptococcaceae bacterium]